MSVNPKLKLGEGAVVCVQAVLEGDVSIGAGCVIHPSAEIRATKGAVVLGDNCMMEEMSKILWDGEGTLQIGAGNVMQIGAVLDNPATVGEANAFQVHSFVGRGVGVGSGCVVGTRVRLETPESLPDLSVVYGADARRRTAKDRPPSQIQQMELLRKMLPSYHYLAKAK